ncbi:MAG: sigma 54-interacting transcriptional regulator, partial [Pseudomonadota bacterium]|nr:sigma 54-interacting transcriptional regulator [Pseudomonadota bacterium]
IIKAVELARKFSPKIAITSEIPVKGIDLIEKLYQVTVKQIIFTDKNDFLYGLTKAVHDGCEVIIGKSKLAVELAEQYGAKGVLVTYDTDILGEAIDEAVRMAILRRREKEQYIWLETIFDNLSEGIIVIDKNASITRFNLAASHILKCSPKQMIGSRIKDHFPALKMEAVLQSKATINNELISIGDQQIMVKNTPIVLDEKIIGVAGTFRQASEIQKMDSKIRKALRKKGFKAQYTISHFAAKSPRMKEILREAQQYAQVDLTILLIGETGTGKEVLAQSIHNLSPRQRGPFIAVNCSVLPDNLLESELFGYEEGAFTGARKGGKPGLFELAQHGTILLDEINTIPLNLQAKLLRVLQEREVMRVGGAHIIPIDVKIIAAANQNIFCDLEESRFRTDLYYRLNQLSITLPRLQDRKEDIPELAQAIFNDLRRKFSKTPFSLPTPCIKHCQKIPWPGNVRELQNFLGRLALLCENEEEVAENINKIIGENQHSHPIDQATPLDKTTKSRHREERSLVEQEKTIILRTLKECNNNISETSRRLSISRTTLYRKMNKLQQCSNTEQLSK